MILRHSGGNSECAGKVDMIEWGLIGGTAMKAAAGSAAGKLAGLLVEKGKAKIFPGELERALQEGLAAAQMEDQALSRLAICVYILMIRIIESFGGGCWNISCCLRSCGSRWRVRVRLMWIVW